MKSHVVGCALALALAGAVNHAWADTVTMQSQVMVNGTADTPITSGFVGLQNGLTVTATLSPTLTKTTTIVGAFGWTVTDSTSPLFSTGENLYGYCIQKSGDFYGYPSSYTFTVNPAVTGSPTGGIDAGILDPTAALEMQALVNAHWDDSLTSNVNAAAFQLALWEIEYDADAGGETLGTETESDYFANGIIHASWSGAGTDPTLLATDWLNALTDLPGSITSAVALNSSETVVFPDGSISNVQDMLVQVVPLPPALSAGLATLAGLLLVRKLARRRASNLA